MITATQRPDTDGAVRQHPWAARRRLLLLIDSSFLIVAGTAQVAFELLSHYVGAGPYGSIFLDSPHILGWVEAHGLAVVIGVLILAVGAWEASRLWQVVAIAVHLLLATANIVFWASFSAFELVGMGLVATVAHFLFIAAHVISMAGRQPQVSR